MATKKNAPKGATVKAGTATLENNSPVTVEDEASAMKQQVLYQFKQLLKMAETMGIKLEDIYEKPPVDTIKIIAPEAPVASAKLKPGSVIGTGINASWVQWTKEDLDPEDTVTFSPLPIPGVVYPFVDENGYQKIKLDVNGLVCWFTCGIPNTVNRYFWHAYDDLLTNWRNLEDFKRNGPAYAPWGARGPNGEKAWVYTPMAASFGMTDDGRSLRMGGPTPLDPTPTEPSSAEVISPPAGSETK